MTLVLDACTWKLSKSEANWSNLIAPRWLAAAQVINPASLEEKMVSIILTEHYMFKFMFIFLFGVN